MHCTSREGLGVGASDPSTVLRNVFISDSQSLAHTPCCRWFQLEVNADEDEEMIQAPPLVVTLRAAPSQSHKRSGKRPSGKRSRETALVDMVYQSYGSRVDAIELVPKTLERAGPSR